MDNLDFTISTDKGLLDVDFIHAFLEKSYWANGIPRDIVEQSIENSLCFGVYFESRQVGFARVITDYSTFAFLSDVFIDNSTQGQGLGKVLLKHIMGYPKLSHLRRWHLVTKDAQKFYLPFEFSALEYPDQHMEITRKNIYLES